MGGGGTGGGGGAAAAARADEQARQERIRQGTESINQTFAQFDDNFYNKRREDALSYFNPQFDQQYQDARNALAFSLDSSGLTNSSVRAQREEELQRLYDTNRRAVADQALGHANTARTNVERARGDLISMLNASGDAGGAANSAMSRASALAAPDTYSPLGQLFSTFTSALGQQAGLERASSLSGGQFGGRYNTGLFGVPKTSVTVQN